MAQCILVIIDQHKQLILKAANYCSLGENNKLEITNQDLKNAEVFEKNIRENIFKKLDTIYEDRDKSPHNFCKNFSELLKILKENINMHYSESSLFTRT